MRGALAALLAGALAQAALAGAVVEGRVELPRTGPAPVLIQRYEVVSQGGVLSTLPPLAVVYLEGPFPARAAPPAATMAQKDLAFVPALLAIEAGTRVDFPNLDPTYHNVFSYSAAKRFDLGRYRSSERPIPSVLFDTPGLVTVHCDIHEHMRALILVLDTPYFTITRPDGSFRLAGLPPGHHVLKVWKDSRTTLTRPVDLADRASLRADFP
ncbi:MAG TPA: carboxypeptidase regulatory-like domain-containing protein [Opitutaceae bacterium]|nr:carboxypeptidase regulatory-like domain-containing protein [Opitutaceae bacterium]